jgi:hypothetical protein
VKDCKICRVCEPLRDQIMALYRLPMSGAEIHDALHLDSITVASVNNWLTRHIPDDEREKHRKEVYMRFSREQKGKLPRDHDRTGKLLCGNCKQWMPDEGGRINTHRYGRCAKHDIVITRCGFCVDEMEAV